MGMLAWILGILGGLCAVMGIITAIEVVPVFMEGLTTMYWLVLAAVLLLGCIAATLGRGESYQ